MDFTVIAERINMTRKRIRKEVWDRNGEFIAYEAKKQAEAGATHIDVNAGGDPSKEVDDMKWITGVVMEATELPLVFDSANPDALRAGLELCNRPGTLVNSITGEKERIRGVLPLVEEFGTGIICLTMDDAGMPEDHEGRMRIARDLVALLEKKGIGLERAYVDFLVRPAATDPGQAPHILEAVRALKREHPEVHVAVGLSNVSFGIPKRNNLNRAWLAMLIAAGCDGAIMDPCEESMMNTLISARAVLGLDDYCMDYLTAYRGGKL
jgi:5-methyltetrahydrofolate--homocysteine methyltransferase